MQSFDGTTFLEPSGKLRYGLCNDEPFYSLHSMSMAAPVLGLAMSPDDKTMVVGMGQTTRCSSTRTRSKGYCSTTSRETINDSYCSSESGYAGSRKSRKNVWKLVQSQAISIDCQRLICCSKATNMLQPSEKCSNLIIFTRKKRRLLPGCELLFEGEL
ncbi:hypothetical protein KIN20_029042 [Parelaphostrongylus tenuis]|uniref:Uncharacterized protein n=1 Tax=Parelaphostrongylus tenuis TaxID=148309 RepID=A0AAD5R228_PARTN|nr:hypothetical protein KIN20_029042 [Parelaphostrongylus tenuis]